MQPNFFSKGCSLSSSGLQRSSEARNKANRDRIDLRVHRPIVVELNNKMVLFNS